MIERDVQVAARRRYDLIIVGGGIYGASLALESARRGLLPLLVERCDFGHATSHKSLRIIHGGLRYLQTLDLRRYRQSVRERSWFLQNFSDLVWPMPCLMPLYGRGARGPGVFNLALRLNDLLSRRRNRHLQKSHHLPNGRVLSAAETAAMFPQVDPHRLRGGALWHDAHMKNSQRVLIEVLHWACACNATALNYVEAVRAILDGRNVTGLLARDRVTGETFTFKAPVIVNCAGPWCREVALRLDRDHSRLFEPSLAFNVLLDRQSLSRAAVAVTPKRTNARTYFLLPWHSRILAGTYHARWPANGNQPRPRAEQVGRFLSDLNVAVPGIRLTQRDVLRVDAGLIPARAPMSKKIAKREVIIDHARHAGPRGLFSVSGVKFTTARLVAARSLRRICGSRVPSYCQGADRPPPTNALDLNSPHALFENEPDKVAAGLRQLIATESVLQLDDLLLRRTAWLENPTVSSRVASIVGALLGPEFFSQSPLFSRSETDAKRISPTFPGSSAMQHVTPEGASLSQ